MSYYNSYKKGQKTRNYDKASYRGYYNLKKKYNFEPNDVDYRYRSGKPSYKNTPFNNYDYNNDYYYGYDYNCDPDEDFDYDDPYSNEIHIYNKKHNKYLNSKYSKNKINNKFHEIGDCFRSSEGCKPNKFWKFSDSKDSGNKETFINSKKNENSNSKNQNQFIITNNFFNSSFTYILNQSNCESENISEDLLFEEIKRKLNQADYNQEGLIKDMNALISKNAFIKKFNEHSFLTTESFCIFDYLDPLKIHLNLNLINFINIINAIHSFIPNDSVKLAEILDKLGINFSWIKRTEQSIDIILLTPKSSILYNYLSTHGICGIENKEYSDKVKEFIQDIEKNGFDYGYCYEDLSTSHLIESMGEDSFKVHPNVMYYIKKDVALKLVKLNLVKIPESYKIANSLEDGKIYSGFDETDLFISMFKNIEIERNFNFRDILKGDLKVNKKKLFWKKENTIYLK